MNKFQIVSAAILTTLLAGCDGKLPHDGPAMIDGGAGGSGGQGGSAETSDANVEEPDARGDGSVGDAGGIEADAMGADTCGDGVRGLNEFCDGDDLHGADCTAFGFTSGTLRCSEACQFDFHSCSGVEVCFDGVDNDGDNKSDCEDSDCAAACANSCASAPTISGDELLNGNTKGKPSNLASSCVLPGTASGSELVFRFVAPQAGVFEATLTAISADLTLSIRTSCAEDGSEVVCSNTSAGAGAMETAVIQVQPEEELFIVVDGAGPDEAGAFSLQTSTRPLICGDGTRDPGEKCDDGNTASGDGCSSSCEIESTEAEPNDTTATAHPYDGAPEIAEISNVNDVDTFSFTIEHDGSTLSAETLDLGDGTCASLTLDDRIDILGTNGEPIASDDDSGEGFCALASASDLAPGTYYVRVRASGVATEFPYRLSISSTP